MAILQSAKDKINESAFKRYQQRQKDHFQASEIKYRISSGDQQYQHESTTKNKSVGGGVFARVSVCPDGFKRYKLLSSACAAKETGASGSSGAKSALVLPAKSQSQFLESIDKNTGEIQQLTPGKTPSEYNKVFCPDESLINRFILQSEARKILKTQTKLNASGRPVPVYRVCDCLRNSVSGADGVGVSGTSQSDLARFTGLQTCGSVWHCPVCSARVSEFRRRQIREMVDVWQKSGKGVIFITNTIRHDFDDDLRLMLSNLLDLVWNRYINHRTYKNLRSDLGYIGRVRSVEVTYGSNGWHPHIHEIWLIDRVLSAAELKTIQKKLYMVWNTTLFNAGMSPVTLARGVTVQNGSNASDYIAKFGQDPKWDIGRELTSGHSKKSSGKGRTPFDLLRDSVRGDLNASRLFKEYAIAFAGKRQLYYSTGLKDFFQLEDKTDDEIASSVDFDTVQLAHIDSDSWRLILLYGSRPTVLIIARTGGASAVSEYINSLRTIPCFVGHKLIT
ncbi:MAG: protein rep [Gallionella sp.]|nr:protein rep [Gallionella sp.]MDP1942120.1 protein rep [Gallionella sp.]